MTTNNYEYRALGAYKQILFEILTDEQNPKCELLIDLLMPALTDSRFDKLTNFIGGEEEYDNSRVILPSHLFDVPFIYSTVTDTRNAICIDNNIVTNNPNTKRMAITIDLMCHKDSLLLSSKERRRLRKEGYIARNRVDAAVAVLGDILNRADIKSIGKLQPNPRQAMVSYYPNNVFFGKTLNYIADDFMIDYGKLSLNEE